MKKVRLLFNPLTGTFDFIEVSDHHSGVDFIKSSETLYVDENKQMVIFDSLTVDGDLVVRGTLVLRE